MLDSVGDLRCGDRLTLLWNVASLRHLQWSKWSNIKRYRRLRDEVAGMVEA
jgi:hypothetical protein